MKEEFTISEIIVIANNIISAGNRAFVSPYHLSAVDSVINEHYEVKENNWFDDEKIVKKLAKAYDSIRGNFLPQNYKGDVPYAWAAYYISNNSFKAQDLISNILLGLTDYPKVIKIIEGTL